MLNLSHLQSWRWLTAPCMWLHCVKHHLNEGLGMILIISMLFHADNYSINSVPILASMVGILVPAWGMLTAAFRVSFGLGCSEVMASGPKRVDGRQRGKGGFVFVLRPVSDGRMSVRLSPAVRYGGGLDSGAAALLAEIEAIRRMSFVEALRGMARSGSTHRLALAKSDKNAAESVDKLAVLVGFCGKISGLVTGAAGCAPARGLV